MWGSSRAEAAALTAPLGDPGLGPDPDPDPKSTQAAESAEVAALLAAENVALVPEEESDRLGPLDSLTGVPVAEDVLLFALPVCPERNV